MFPKGGMGKLMKQAQEMQEKMSKVQEELNKMEVEGQSGGGMIKATVNGKKELLSLKIEDAIRYLSRQAPLSVESAKPQIPSKKFMWIANRTKVQNMPEGAEVKDKDKSDLTPPLASKEVQTLLKHVEKCVKHAINI